MLYRFYVGANNATGNVDREKLTAYLDARFDGYTLIDASGRWKGKAEPCVIVELQDGDLSEAKAIALAVDLARELEQQAVAFNAVPMLTFATPDGIA